ncbi:MAG TPA: hypothetical protein VH988_32435 [Thermoanaerobaculia bacterium]|nr:hypothetical protein [Thermoanaerobaculia bacterium]
MEKPRPRDHLSWAVTVVCCLYIVWVTHFFASNVPAIGTLFAGLGAGIVPWISSAVVAVSGGFFPYLAAAILIGGLIAKEFSRLSRDAKIAVTVIVYIAVSWFLQLSVEAVFLPLLDVLKKIGD